MGEIVGILRRTLSIEDFSVLLDLDLRTPLSPLQVIGIIRNAKSKLESQIKEILNEISQAESLSILRAPDEEVLNEEGLPIKDIREDVFDDDEKQRPRAVLAEEELVRKYTMEEIYRMMDEAMAEEQAEMQASQPKLRVEKEKDNGVGENSVTAAGGQGLEVGQVSGEELLAKLVNDHKNRYNPIDDTWVEDEDGDGATDPDDNEDYEEYDDEEDEGEDEEDQYGRTRGFLVPPQLSKGVTRERSVKFASFEKPSTPSIISTDKPIKSALKKGSVPATTPSSAPAVPVKSTKTAPIMATNIVERTSEHRVLHVIFRANTRIPKWKIPRRHAK